MDAVTAVTLIMIWAICAVTVAAETAIAVNARRRDGMKGTTKITIGLVCLASVLVIGVCTWFTLIMVSTA